MKNFNLYLFRIELHWNQYIEKKTLITTDIITFQHFLSQYPSFSPVKVHIISQEVIEIRAVKDKLLHSLFHQYFKTSQLLEYAEHLPYNSDIQNMSVLKNFLFSQNQYQPTNDFEQFLFTHNILKSYYEQNIIFSVQVIHKEYSREFGERIFNSQYSTKRIDYDFLTKGKNRYHSSHIYSSDTKEKIIKFSGLNDQQVQFEYSF